MFDWLFYHRSSAVVPKDKQPDNVHCEKKGKRSKNWLGNSNRTDKIVTKK